MIRVKIFILTLFSLVLCIKVEAQKYVLSDANFLAALKQDYPSLIVDDSLEVSAAQNFEGMLNLGSKGIRNVDGLQFFEKVDFVNLRENQIVTLPDLGDLDSLVSLHIFGNNLTELPVLPNTIKTLLAYNNQLTTVASIEGLSELDYLHVSNNRLIELPDLSNFPKLTKLHCNQNQLTSLDGLESLTQLVDLFCWSNKIKSLDGLSDNTTIVNFFAYHNELTSLPNLLNKPNLLEVLVHGNYLTFEDIRAYAAIERIDTVMQYSFMKNFQNGEVLISYEEQDISIVSGVDTTVSTINYELFVNNISVGANTDGKFTVTSDLFDDDATAHIKVTTPDVPDLTIEETGWILKKRDCEALLPMYLTVLQNDCVKGADIKLVSEEDPLDFHNTAYSLRATSTDIYHELDTTMVLNEVPQGAYELRAVLTDKCSVAKIINVPNAPNCDYIFTPNGDGIKDTFYFDQTGEIQIFNTRGECIKKLTAPAIWDGTDKTGSLVPLGYYTIIVNENEVFHVTVMK